MSDRIDRALLAIKAAARRGGVELLRFNATNALDAQRTLLVRNERIDLVVDVGANEGQWARALRRGGYAGEIVSFEPLANAHAALERACANDPHWSWRAEAASDRAGEAELRVAGNGVSSSLLAMADRHASAAPGSAVTGTQRVRTVRLDEAGLRGERLMLKLDVQGAELLVLRGAERLLPSIALIELELSFERLYVDGPLWREAVDELDTRGYDLVAMSPTWVDEASGRLLQADAIFAAR